jgi:hypothetical protein
MRGIKEVNAQTGLLPFARLDQTAAGLDLLSAGFPQIH